jgi:nitroreductase
VNDVDDPVLRAIFSRRVVRNMTDQPVTGADLEVVLRAARAAPSAGNRRLQPVVPVSDPAQLRLLRMVSPGMLARPQAAAVICIDRARGEAYGFAPDTPGLYIDVGTRAATMLLAAHALGLAAQPVTSFSRVAAARLLGLRVSLEPRMIVCLGHPAVDQPPPMGGWRSAVGASE